jgi:uncharacterized protein with PIN domain
MIAPSGESPGGRKRWHLCVNTCDASIPGEDGNVSFPKYLQPVWLASDGPLLSPYDSTAARIAWRRLACRRKVLQVEGVIFEVQLTFHGDFAEFFVAPRLRRQVPIIRQLREKTAVKDVIEACGVPHPEVDLIVASLPNGEVLSDVDFRWQVTAPVRFDVYGVPAPSDVLPSAARLQSRRCVRFVVDGHLGKLARNLRLLGLDTFYACEADDAFLLQVMVAEDRALLTRDRRLLMHSVVRDGFFPRSVDPEEQTTEVLHRFGLLGSASLLTPFVRCLECNGLLKKVPKAEVLERLSGEPLTLRYYNDYRMCSACRRIYWSGTHFNKLTRRVSKFVDH